MKMLVRINESVLFCLITANERPVGRQSACRTSAPSRRDVRARVCVCGHLQAAVAAGALK